MAGGGFRPVITVCGKAGNESLRIARAAHDLLDPKGVVEPGVVSTDSLVSFSLRLADGDMAMCEKQVTSTDTNCEPASGPAVAKATKNKSPSPARPQPAQPVAPAQPVTPAQLVAGGDHGCPAGQAVNPHGGCMPPACAAGQIRDANGTCVAPTPDTPYGPPPEFANCHLVDSGSTTTVHDAQAGNYHQSDFSRAVSTDRIPPGRGPKHVMTGSYCMLCGDYGKREPCNDLDLVIGMVNKCPDTQPICTNVAVRQSDGLIGEYHYCNDYDSVYKDARGSTCVGGGYNVGPEVGSYCTYSCYGDNCNLVQVGDTVNNVKVVCD